MDSSSNRGQQFIAFADRVVHHIDVYTIPQYGDAPDDMVEQWSAEHVNNQIQRYLRRMHGNGRGAADNILSCMKIAHYACILDAKLREEKTDGDSKSKS